MYHQNIKCQVSIDKWQLATTTTGILFEANCSFERPRKDAGSLIIPLDKLGVHLSKREVTIVV